MKFVASGKIDGKIQAPPSKSMSVRALAIASVVDGETRIENPSTCNDALSARKVIEALGSSVHEDGHDLVIRGAGSPRSEKLNCDESGLSLRMFCALAALHKQPLVLEARGSLCHRPMDMIPGPLRALGAFCQTSGGLAPISVQGPLRGGHARVDGGETSQFLSGLLVACPLAEKGCELIVSGLKSVPYVLMTLDLLKHFGVSWQRDTLLSHFYMEGQVAYRKGVSYLVEGDWSGAAAMLVLGAMTGRVAISGLGCDSFQADKAVLDALGLAGATVQCRQDLVVVSKGSLSGFRFDVSHCPDLAPYLAALGCACDGQTVIKGAARLKNKESDRASVLVEQLGRMGADIRRDGDSILVRGPQTLECESVDPHGDHRMAMALAVAAVGTGGSVGIEDHGCVAKSYPGFFDDIANLGAEVR